MDRMGRKTKIISDFDVCLGLVVKSKRVKAELSRADLTAATGIADSNLKRREAGENEISVSELERIAEAVHVPAADIVKEALHDYGGIDKLLLEFVSTSAVDDMVTAEDTIDFLGDVKARYDIAADENTRK